MTGKSGIVLMGIALGLGVPTLAAAKKDKTPPSKPLPIGSPGSWISQKDYPAAARDAGIEGRTGFTLDVDRTGRPTNCIVTVSSGSDMLDTAACQAFLANARFTPSHDSRNRPVAGKWESTMRWQLAVMPSPVAPTKAP